MFKILFPSNTIKSRIISIMQPPVLRLPPPLPHQLLNPQQLSLVQRNPVDFPQIFGSYDDLKPSVFVEAVPIPAGLFVSLIKLRR